MDIQSVCVADIMHAHVHTVTEDTPLAAAVCRMHQLGTSSLVVEKKTPNDAFGIVTRKDLVMAFLVNLHGIKPAQVRDVMTKPSITVEPELALEHAMHLMRMAGVRRLPVVKDGRLVGILSNSDLFRCLAEYLDDSQASTGEAHQE